MCCPSQLVPQLATLKLSKVVPKSGGGCNKLLTGVHPKFAATDSTGGQSRYSLLVFLFNSSMSATSFYNKGTNNDHQQPSFLSSYFAALIRTHGNVASYTNKSPSLEYLFEDVYASSGPSWGARICYGTGITYLTFLGIGGTWGLLSPFSTSQLKSLTSPRLKYNAILNSVTAKGPFVANNAAILALLYNLVHGAMIRGRDGKWDVGSAVGSAALVGTIFKSTAGWKSALKTGGVLGTAMLVYQMADTAYDQYQRHNY